MWELAYDKLADLLVLGASVGVGAMWKKNRDIDKKFNYLELELAKNYVTKPELKNVEEKLDHLAETMTSKIDTVNSNIMILLRTSHAP